ncbi:MAG: hypothetical protein J7L42_02390 [Elusimicrobia bacterium]|nr:hypothetical protein [Elusimicrobiota bacterium]
MKNFFQKEIEKARIGNSYIFEGPEKEIKFQFAIELAKALNCASGGCGICETCKEIQTFKHPDVKIFTTTTSVKIDDIRDFIRFMNLSKLNANYKVGIIKDGELLTPEATSALLKILEEPPLNSIIVIITSSLYRLLPTIRSRCQIVRFPPKNFVYQKISYEREFFKEVFEWQKKKQYDVFFEKLSDYLDAENPRERVSQVLKGFLLDLYHRFRDNPFFCEREISSLMMGLELLRRQASAKFVLHWIFFEKIPEVVFG